MLAQMLPLAATDVHSTTLAFDGCDDVQVDERVQQVCRYYNEICLHSRDFLPVTNRTPRRMHWRVIAHWEALYQRTYVKRRGVLVRSCLNAQSRLTLFKTTYAWALFYLGIKWCPMTSDYIKLWYFYTDTGWLSAVTSSVGYPALFQQCHFYLMSIQ